MLGHLGYRTHTYLGLKEQLPNKCYFRVNSVLSNYLLGLKTSNNSGVNVAAI